MIIERVCLFERGWAGFYCWVDNVCSHYRDPAILQLSEDWVESVTQDLTRSRPPISGWRRMVSSQSCSCRLRRSKKEGRYFPGDEIWWVQRFVFRMVEDRPNVVLGGSAGIWLTSSRYQPSTVIGPKIYVGINYSQEVSLPAGHADFRMSWSASGCGHGCPERNTSKLTAQCSSIKNTLTWRKCIMQS